MFSGKSDLPWGAPLHYRGGYYKYMWRWLAQWELAAVTPGLEDGWVDAYFKPVEKEYSFVLLRRCAESPEFKLILKRLNFLPSTALAS